MAFSTITSEMESAAVAQIASSSFYATFGDATLSEALRQPLAQQSTRVRRAIKDSYKRDIDQSNIQGNNQTFDHNSIDDSFKALGESQDDGSDNNTLNSYDETNIYFISNGVLVQKAFLTKDPTDIE